MNINKIVNRRNIFRASLALAIGIIAVDRVRPFPFKRKGKRLDVTFGDAVDVREYVPVPNEADIAIHERVSIFNHGYEIGGLYRITNHFRDSKSSPWLFEAGTRNTLSAMVGRFDYQIGWKTLDEAKADIIDIASD